MKTTKRKRSPKSTPAVEVLDSAPAAASAEPAPVAVVAAESANDPVVAEAGVAEVVTAEPASQVLVSDSVVTEAVVAADPVVSESVVAEVTAADETVAAEAAADETVAAVVANDVIEPVVAAAPSAAVEVVASNKPSSADAVVVLAANCSIKDAGALKNSLCAVANETAAVTLDASAVERVDTATMQLLCAFVRDRSARKQSIVWRGESQALNDAVRLLGVAALIGFDAPKGAAA